MSRSQAWWSVTPTFGGIRPGAGRKKEKRNRPCAVVLTILDAQGRKCVLLAPITHTPPGGPGRGIEIPVATKKRLGLSERPSWVITDELNRFIWPGPDIRPTQRGSARIDFGVLPAALFERIKAQIRTNAKTTLARTVDRGE